MAVIQSGASSDLMTVDPTSKAARCTLYGPDGAMLGSVANPFAVKQGTGRTVQGQYSASIFRTQGSAGTPQNVAGLFLQSSATVSIALKSIQLSLDSTAALATVSPSVKLSRAAGIPSGGYPMSAEKFRSAHPNAQATVLGPSSVDGGAPSAIVATAGAPAWVGLVDRLHSADGYVAHPAVELLPPYWIDPLNPFVLVPGEAVLVQAVGANAATTWFVVNFLWEEFT